MTKSQKQTFGTCRGCRGRDEVHGWRLGGQYQPNVGITGLELRRTSAPLFDKHNDQASVIPFIQNNEYVLHLLEKTTQTLERRHVTGQLTARLMTMCFKTKQEVCY